MARPRIELTDEQIAQVEALASVLTQEQIADYLGIGRTTFHEILKRQPEVSEQYKKGKAKAVESIANNLITQAKSGNVTAGIFYLKTQAGWREQEQQSVELPPINIVLAEIDEPDEATDQDIH